jgi:hypothetical protein
MGNASSNNIKDNSEEYLGIDNDINILIKTKINYEKIKKKDEIKIKKYIKKTIEEMSSGNLNYISHYIFIKKYFYRKIIKNYLSK